MDLKANTQVIVTIGPFVAVGDGFTPVTTVVLTGGGAADEAELVKHNTTAGVDISTRTWAVLNPVVDGYYNLTLTTADTGVEGNLVVVIQDDSLCLPVRAEFRVLAEAAYDSLYAAKDTGFMDVNVKAVSEDTTAADNLELQYDGTGLLGDAFPLRQDQGASISGGLAIRTAMASVTVIQGSQQDLGNASTSNDTRWTGDDDGAGAEFIFRCTPADTDARPGDLHFEGYYNEPTGSTNGATLEVYNFQSAAWESVATFTNASSDEDHDIALHHGNRAPGGGTLETVAFTIGDVLIKFKQDTTETGNAVLLIDLMQVGFIGSTLTATAVVDEWETQSQANPTGFHVNVQEWIGTAVTLSGGLPDINVGTIDANAITATSINADAITNAKIADDAIAAENLATGAFTADAFAADAIVAATLATGALTADAFAADAIVAATLATGALTADAFAADALVAATFATGALTADAFAANAINNATFAADVGSTAYATNIIALAVRKALDEIHLDHLLDQDYDPAAKPGVATALFNELIESNAGVSRFTAAALANASGTGASAEDIADAVLDEMLSGHATSGTLGQAMQRGRVFYLDSAAANDSADGLTWANAKQTIAGVQALSLVAGDTVLMRGLFRVAATLSEDGLPTLPITWQAATPLGATISGATVIANGSFASHSGDAYKITMADPVIVLEDDGSLDGASGRDNKVMLTEESSIANVIANAGTWFHDGSVLYVQATDSTDITANGYLYEGGSVADPVSITGDDVTLLGLRVEGATERGIKVTGARPTLSRCEVRYTNNECVRVTDAPGALIEDCHVRDTQTTDNACILITGSGSTGAIVRRCRITEAVGVRITASGSVIIEDSYLSAGADGNYCIIASSSAGEVIVRHNFIHGSAFNTVNFTGSALGGAVYGNLIVGTQAAERLLRVGDLTGDLVVVNNTFYNEVSNGNNVNIDGTTFNRCIFKNNIVVTNGRTMKLTVVAGAVDQVEMDNNLYYSDTGYAFSWDGTTQTSLADHQTVNGQEANSVVGDPKFIDPTAGVDNFALADGSPAISMGADLDDILASLTLKKRYSQLISPGTVWPGSVQMQDQGVDGSAWIVGAMGRSYEQVLAESTSAIPASSAGRVTGYFYCYDEDGVPESGVLMTMSAQAIGGTGVSLDSELRTETSDANGLVSFTNLFLNAVYQVHRGTSSPNVITIAPDAVSPVELENVVGID